MCRKPLNGISTFLDSAVPKEALGRGGSAAYELRDDMGDRTMRMLAQDRAFHLNLRVDGTDDAEALRRLRILEGIEMVRGDLSAAAACKARIALDLAARWPDRALSEATVGRILRWAVKPRDRHVGVQFDHTAPHIDGKTRKEFRAVCPNTRPQRAKACSRATAGVARAFLREAVRKLDVRAVQVDGGSESVAAFEAECRGLGLPLLPPRSPQLNGIVERANRTVRVECWSQCRGDLTCVAMNEALARYLDYCNNRRRHRSLGTKTPAEFARMMAAAA